MTIRKDVVPNIAKNFLARCTGKVGYDNKGHEYKGRLFHRLVNLRICDIEFSEIFSSYRVITDHMCAAKGEDSVCTLLRLLFLIRTFAYCDIL